VSASSNTEIVDAHAKLNLFLRVLGRRPDGYHEVETAILPISLADRLTIHASAEPGLFRTLSLELRLTGDPDLVAGVPADESNLVVRAATELAGRGGTKGFAEITLHKRVPSAAGLGGGSADAAATLHALNRLWGAALDAGSLMDVAARVGSDVPALLFGALRAGAPLMQIKAGIPAELIDVLQAMILLFLVANPVLKRALKLRGVKAGIDTTETIAPTSGGAVVH